MPVAYPGQQSCPGLEPETPAGVFAAICQKQYFYRDRSSMRSYGARAYEILRARVRARAR